MILHLDEYLKYASSLTESQYNKVSRIKKFDAEKKYLHEMSSAEILKLTESKGGDTVYQYRQIFVSYFTWLMDNYTIDTSDLIYGINGNSANKIYLGVLDIDDLRRVVGSAINQYELSVEQRLNTFIAPQNIWCVYYLEWFGIPSDAILSIRLRDIQDKGKAVYVPILDKTISITDDVAADIIWEWSQAISFEVTSGDQRELKGNCLLRTSRGNFTQTSLYKIYSKMKTPKLSKSKVFKAGVYAKMLDFEQKRGENITFKSDFSLIKSEFYKPDLSRQRVLSIIREYNTYKEAYLERSRSLDDLDSY